MDEWQGANGWLAYAAPVILKATLMLGAAWLVAWRLRERSAATRHLVWVVAVVGVIAMPALHALFPVWQVPVPAWTLAWADEVVADDVGRSQSAGGTASDLSATGGLAAREAGERFAFVRSAAPAQLGTPETEGRSMAWSPEASAASVEPSTAAGAPAAVTAADRDLINRDPAEITKPLSRTPASGTVSEVRAVGARAAPRSWGAFSIMLVWLSGAAAVAAQSALATVHVHLLRRRARDVTDRTLVRRADHLAATMGVARPVRLLEGDADSMPMTFGLLRTWLLLPSTARAWSSQRQEAVLRHELAHIRRRDSLAQLLGDVACILYWFHPLVWVAAWRLRIEREHACDDVVLLSGARASDYAAELLEIARTMRARRLMEPAAVAMARPSRLRTRLAAVLEDRPRATRLPARRLVPVWIGALAGTAALSAMVPLPAPAGTGPSAGTALLHSSPTAADAPARGGSTPRGAHAPFFAQALTETQPEPALPEDPASEASPPGPLSAPPRRQAPECFIDDRRGRFIGQAHSRRIDGTLVIDRSGHTDGDFVIQRRIDDMTLCLRTPGGVTLGDPGLRIESLDEDAWIVIASRWPAGTQTLQITPGPAGPEHSWFVNGIERPYDVTARAWHGLMLELLGGFWEIGRIRGEVSSLRGQIASIRGRESSLRGEIASIRGRESSLRGEISSVRGHESSLRGQISSIRGQESTYRGEIASIRGEVSSMQGEISGLRGHISSLQTAQRVTGDAETSARLDSEIEEIRDAILAVERRIAAYDADGRVADVERRSAEHDEPGRIRDVEDQIRAYDAAARVREIESQIEAYDVEARIREVEDRIGDLDVAGNVDRLERRIEAVDADRRVLGIEERLEGGVDRLREILTQLR